MSEEIDDQYDYNYDIGVTEGGYVLTTMNNEGLDVVISGISETNDRLIEIINNLCKTEMNRPRRITQTCGNPPAPHSLKLKRRPITTPIKGFSGCGKNK